MNTGINILLKKVKNKNGFTLLEMIIVIAIIAILLGLIAPSIFKILNQANETVIIAECRQVVLMGRTKIVSDMTEGKTTIFKPPYKEVKEDSNVSGTIEVINASDNDITKVQYTNGQLTVIYENGVYTILKGGGSSGGDNSGGDTSDESETEQKPAPGSVEDVLGGPKAKGNWGNYINKVLTSTSGGDSYELGKVYQDESGNLYVGSYTTWIAKGDLTESSTVEDVLKKYPNAFAKLQPVILTEADFGNNQQILVKKGTVLSTSAGYKVFLGEDRMAGLNDEWINVIE